eukprot:TRINITY_DN113916_c0_g1_i1.p1 TRINITY_DN113916_c0_g1~~TRINITY_DN113916_c0_g1_i1.p1  ORF type:complete len:723 (+),score=210.83 TRINITY_DN113916_c0_g1_i1:51-2219(+)
MASVHLSNVVLVLLLYFVDAVRLGDEEAQEIEVATVAESESIVCNEACSTVGILLTLDDTSFNHRFMAARTIGKDGHVKMLQAAPVGQMETINVPNILQSIMPIHSAGGNPVFMADNQETKTPVIVKWGDAEDTEDIFALANLSHQLNQRMAMKEDDDSPAEGKEAKAPEKSEGEGKAAEGKTGKEGAASLLEKSGPAEDENTADSEGSEGESGGDTKKDDKKAAGKEAAKKKDGKKGDAHAAGVKMKKRMPAFNFIFAPAPGGVRKCGPRPTANVQYVGAQTGDKLEISPGQSDNGYNALKNLMFGLVETQKTYALKFAVGRTKVGDAHAKSAGRMLSEGELNADSPGLSALVSSYMEVIKDLQALTSKKEKKLPRSINGDIAGLKTREEFLAVMPETDAYSGHNINKNYDPNTGRLPFADVFGSELRAGMICVSQSELKPAVYLAHLLQMDTSLEMIFSKLAGKTALNVYSEPNVLQGMLRQALEVNGAGRDRMWNAGIGDGSIHNVILSTASKKIWFYDMGKPYIVSGPAFAAKFLSSFFIDIGMEAGDGGVWLNRFHEPKGTYKTVLQPPSEPLNLTAKGELALMRANASFSQALSTFTKDVFGDESAVCELMVRYVILDILSDASFVLARWKQKKTGTDGSLSPCKLGGKLAKTDKECNAQWLWRALFNYYVASSVAQGNYCTNAAKKAMDKQASGKEGEAAEQSKETDGGEAKQGL